MTAPIFGTRGHGLSLRDIAALTGAQVQSGAVLDRCMTGVAALDQASPHDLTFLDNIKHAAGAANSSAGACLTSERFVATLAGSTACLVVAHPYRAFVEVARALYPDLLRPSSLAEAAGAAVGAMVHPSARLEAGATIDPGAVVGPQAEIGAGTVIGAGAVIGSNVRIGRDCAIGPKVCIARALIGDRVIIHPSCSIGQDGFGYLMGPGGHRKIPQIGRVIIQDDVEIGANTTIDRGGLRDTVIGEGTKIDNQVQIGHNVTIGRHCIIISQCGISGSSVVGDFAVLAGKVGVADHLTIGEGAVVGAGSGVISNVPPGEKWFGYPAMPGRSYMRAFVGLRRSTAPTPRSRLAGSRGAERSEAAGDASKGEGA